MYTIGEVAKMFNLTVPTLRYYDSEGLFNNLERDKSGIRVFDEKSIEAIRVIECLKKSGMQIKDIKEFMKWCEMGNSTFSKRKEMFLRQKNNIEREIKELEKALSMIKYKCWYYEEAIKDNSEERVRNASVQEMPVEIREAFLNSHLSN